MRYDIYDPNIGRIISILNACDAYCDHSSSAVICCRTYSVDNIDSMLPLKLCIYHCKNRFLIFLFMLFIKWGEGKESNESSQKYVVRKEEVNWYQALISCRGAGMELVTIHTQEEQSALEKFLRDIANESAFWLGATKEGNGEFYWLTGHKMMYTKWLVGQPDNYKEVEYCLGWGVSSKYNLEQPGWNDLLCTLKLPFICQKFQYCESFQ